MERGVAAAASERAQAVDYGVRIVAQEQVGLAYAGWDRLLTRVALPAWRMGRWPSRLDAGVVSALTELSRRDRLAEGFTSRLGERPACDLLEEPGVADEATSLLAARLFHGGPAEPGPDWAPVDWAAYPEEVVDRKWRTEAARLHRVLDALGERRGRGTRPRPRSPASSTTSPPATTRPRSGWPPGSRRKWPARKPRPRRPRRARSPGAADAMPLFPLQPPRTGRELLADHVTAMVCCAAVDTAGALPGLDWLDGPSLLVDGVRRSDLAAPVLTLVEDGDADALRGWLASVWASARRSRYAWSDVAALLNPGAAALRPAPLNPGPCSRPAPSSPGPSLSGHRCEPWAPSPSARPQSGRRHALGPPPQPKRPPSSPLTPPVNPCPPRAPPPPHLPTSGTSTSPSRQFATNGDGVRALCDVLGTGS